jgi:hypothetical protein
MGFDTGFDMVPQLSRTEADHMAWDLFINMVKEEYGTDERTDIKSNNLTFNAGEVPILPYSRIISRNALRFLFLTNHHLTFSTHISPHGNALRFSFRTSEIRKPKHETRRVSIG